MKCFSLFSGIGGFDLAAQRCDYEIVGACEIDRYARQVYARHFPGVAVYEDALRLEASQVPDHDILCAGFPCQAFSIAGKRLGFEESRGTLFFEIARIAKQKRPRLLLLENVVGLLSHDNGRTFAEILATMDEIGYDAEWQVLNSKHFVPQNRERVFIVGHLRGTSGRKIFPLGETVQEPNRGKTEEQIATTLQTPGHACGNYKGMTMILEPFSKNEHRQDRVYSSEGISPTLVTGTGGRHTPMITTEPERANALTTKASHKDASHVINGQRVRRLTPLECERLQGFPDNWTEGISDTQRYRCLGNAVTVPVVQYILERLT